MIPKDSALIPRLSHPLTAVVKDEHPGPGGPRPQGPILSSPRSLPLLPGLELDL